jgi:RHS repeat-associated protein
VTVNGLPAQTYADFTFASLYGYTLADGQNSFTNIATNYYGTASVTNIVTANLPASPILQYDANGNLTNDGSRSFSYDAENQLTNVTVAGQWRSDFFYDGLGRRRIERDYAWQSGAWAITNEVRYLCDGMLVMQELDSNNVAHVTYTRGLDFSGSIQGAGGIGGLLARTDTSGLTFYHADGSGNVTALMDSGGCMSARYLYDPFGRILGKWGTLADANTMRFSSIPRHANSGLSLYTFRAYDPGLQRWLNRDPIGEQGGLNLFGFVDNSPVNQSDPLGLFSSTLYLGGFSAADVAFIMGEGAVAGGTAAAVAEFTAQTATSLGGKCNAYDADEMARAIGKGMITGAMLGPVFSWLDEVALPAYFAAKYAPATANLATSEAVAAAEGASTPIVPGGGLGAHEAAGGHTLELHVGQDTSALLSRALTDPTTSVASSFFDRATAEAAVSSALQENAAEVSTWLSGNVCRPPRFPLSCSAALRPARAVFPGSVACCSG